MGATCRCATVPPAPPDGLSLVDVAPGDLPLAGTSSQEDDWFRRLRITIPAPMASKACVRAIETMMMLAIDGISAGLHVNAALQPHVLELQSPNMALVANNTHPIRLVLGARGGLRAPITQRIIAYFKRAFELEERFCIRVSAPTHNQLQ
ncbi:hypothetical protein SDJN02_14363, partial [Cucurbita argyrosperma subsp. argyrosperma]